MATFGQLTITNAGLALLAKAELGAAIEFTRLAIGDGALGETDPATLADLVNRLMWVTISSINRDSTDVSVAGVFNNEEAAVAFYYREVGLYAEDPDDGEILYMYGNAGETADEIPAAGSQVIERIINITTALSTELTLTVELDPGAYLLVSEFAESFQDGYLRAKVMARVSLSDDQLNLVDSVATKVLVSGIDFDVGDNFDSYKFTAPITGFYDIRGQVSFINVVADKRYSAHIFKNGLSIGSVTADTHSTSTAEISCFVACRKYLTAGQYIELYATSYAGVNTVDIQGYSRTFLEVALVGV